MQPALGHVLLHAGIGGMELGKRRPRVSGVAVPESECAYGRWRVRGPVEGVVVGVVRVW